MVSVSSKGVQGNGDSGDTAISPGGRYVTFYSRSTNLVPGDTNGAADVFIRDRQTGTTKRVSVSALGKQGNADSLGGEMSLDGRLVVFGSEATNLVPGDTNGVADIFVRDLKSHTTERVSVSSGGQQANNGGDGGSVYAAISAINGIIVFELDATNLVLGDTNGADDIFVHTR